MLGVLERVLDGLMPYFNDSQKEQTPGFQELTHAIHPFITKNGSALLPSPLLYSIFVQAFADHNGWCANIEQPTLYQLNLDQKQKNAFLEKMTLFYKEKRQAYSVLLKKILEAQAQTTSAEEKNHCYTRLKKALENDKIIRDDALTQDLNNIHDPGLWLCAIKQRLNARAPGGDILAITDTQITIIETTDEINQNIIQEITRDLGDFLEKTYDTQEEVQRAYDQYRQQYSTSDTACCVVLPVQSGARLVFTSRKNNLRIESHAVDAALLDLTAVELITKSSQDSLLSEEQLLLINAIAPLNILSEKISAQEAPPCSIDTNDLIKHKDALLRLGLQHQAQSITRFYGYYAYDITMLEKLIDIFLNQAKQINSQIIKCLPCQDTVLQKAIQQSTNPAFLLIQETLPQGDCIHTLMFHTLWSVGYIYSIMALVERTKKFLVTQESRAKLAMITEYPQMHRKMLLAFLMIIQHNKALQTKKTLIFLLLLTWMVCCSRSTCSKNIILN